MLHFLSYLVKEYKYWEQSINTANIVFLSDYIIRYISILYAIQIADIFSSKW